MWLDRLKNDELKHWLKRTAVPMLASMPSGEVLWCNEAFESLTGYTSSEIVGKLTWMDLSEAGDDLKADVSMAAEVFSGDREDYMIQKSYKQKNNVPRRCVIHVLRNPYHGDFECYFVSIIPLDHGYEFAVKELEQIRGTILQVMAELRARDSYVKKYFDWLKSSPIQAGIATVVVFVFLFGDRALEIIQKVSVMFGFGP